MKGAHRNETEQNLFNDLSDPGRCIFHYFPDLEIRFHPLPFFKFAIIFLLIALYILSQLKKAGAAEQPSPNRQDRLPAAEEDVSPAEIPSAEIQISSEAVLKRDLADMPEIVYSTVTKETTDDDIFPFVVIDPPGLDPQEDEITEITAIKFDKGYVPVLSFSALLEAEKKLPEGAPKDKPFFGEVGDPSRILSRAAISWGTIFPSMSNSCTATAQDLSPTAKYYNTLPLARKVLNVPSDVENHKLVTLCKYFGIDFSGAQGASDCLATGKVFEKLVETIKQS